jgi:fused signal recognition particle receptor
MPFWRRRTEEPAAPEREVDEPVDPDFVDPSWEPDPADFADPVDGVETQAAPDDALVEPDPLAELVDPLLPFESAPAPPTVMTISIPTPLPTPERPVPTWAEPVREAEPNATETAAPPESPADTAAALDAGLQRTRGGFMARLRGQLGTATGEGPSWDDVEESLIAGDVGAALAIDLVERARRSRETSPEAAIRTELAALLVARDLAWSPRSAVAGGPAVILVVGVNGTGKTTTIGKLASRYTAEGRSVLLAAADTFRAAAIDQLRIWADRAKVPMVAHAPGADPGAVVYDALDAAVARGADLVIADTAGRLHTRSNLMDELSKVRRIIDKRLPGAEPETIFVLDATTGQNGLAQARAFHDAVGLTGIILTKLDSTAKGGIVFAIEDALKIPVRFVGVGEGVNDLIPFDPDAFVAALFA